MKSQRKGEDVIKTLEEGNTVQHRKDTGHRSVDRDENLVGFGMTVQGLPLMSLTTVKEHRPALVASTQQGSSGT